LSANLVAMVLCTNVYFICVQGFVTEQDLHIYLWKQL